jgi:hypothetical protein
MKLPDFRLDAGLNALKRQMGIAADEFGAWEAPSLPADPQTANLPPHAPVDAPPPKTGLANASAGALCPKCSRPAFVRNAGPIRCEQCGWSPCS